MRARISNKLIFILGPEYYANTAFLDLTSNIWTPGPTLSYKRHGHSCNLVTQQSGDKEIVIVGGIDPARDQDCQVQREVEILNLDTMTVRNGKRISVMFRISIILFLIFSK